MYTLNRACCLRTGPSGSTEQDSDSGMLKMPGLSQTLCRASCRSKAISVKTTKAQERSFALASKDLGSLLWQSPRISGG